MLKSKFLRVVFQIETLMLLFTLVMFWFSISLIIDSSLTINDFKKHSGILTYKVTTIFKMVNKPLHKEIVKELHLKLNNQRRLFSFILNSGFADVPSKLQLGDSLMIFTKPKYLGIFGLGKKTAINHLIKRKRVIIDYNDYRQSASPFGYIGLALSVIFLSRTSRNQKGKNSIFLYCGTTYSKI